MTDDELIKKFEAHVAELEKAGNTQRIFMGKKVLTWRGVLEEVKNRTPSGVRYMETMKKIFAREEG